MKMVDKLKAWMQFHGFSRKRDATTQFELVKRIRDGFNSSKEFRYNSCYWGGGSSDMTDWEQHWEKQQKRFLMWSKQQTGDDAQSNVKSPATIGRIISTINRLRRQNFGWSVLPQTEQDNGTALIVDRLLNWAYNTYNFKEPILIWMVDALIHGTSFIKLTPVKQTGYRSYIKTKKFTKQEKKDIASGKVVWEKPKKEVIFEGLVLENIPINEVYVDPQARTIQGNTYKARYVIQRKLMHIDDFRAVYGSRPNAFNVDKVKPLGAYDEKHDYFIRQTTDTSDNNLVEVLIYESELYDEYAVVANDILVEHHPMPFNKKYSIYKLDLIPIPHQFYAAGIADLLQHTQEAEEILFNLMLSHAYRAIDSTFIVDKSIYGEWTQAYMEADNKFIPVSTLDGKPLSSKVMQLKQEPISFDVVRLVDMMQKNETMSTQIDPSQMNLQMVSRTATATLSQKEQADMLIYAFLDQFEVTFTYLGKQVLYLLKEVVLNSKLEKVGNVEQAEEKIINIRLQGEEIVEDKEGIRIEKLSDKKYSFFPITYDKLNTVMDLEVIVKPDSLDLTDRATRRQKVMEAYAQMMPNAVDPNDDRQIEAMRMNGVVPLYDAYKLASKYAKEVAGFDDSVLLYRNFSMKRALDSAKRDVQRILNGEVVAGVPGRSRIHNEYESRVLELINQKVDKLYKDVEVQSQLGNNMQASSILTEYNKWRAIQNELADHLQTDMLPRNAMDDNALMGVQLAIEREQPQQEQEQQNNVQSPTGGIRGNRVPMPSATNQKANVPGYTNIPQV